MKKTLIALLSIFACLPAYAEAPVVWSGTYAKSLASSGFMQKSGETLAVCTTDPSSGGGFVAPVNSVCQGAGSLWFKSGVLNTDWQNILTGGSGWSLLGNAGTGGTAILGTTDAQPFSIRANNTNLLTFSGTDPAFSSAVTQVPADATGLNQFDFRVFLAPSASTTGANNTGFNNQLIWDNGNLGFGNSGGSLLCAKSPFQIRGLSAIAILQLKIKNRIT